MKKIKELILGMIVGVANIIPGVSGGTIMVLLGIYEPIMESISEITTPTSKNKKNSIIYLLTILSGAIIGVLAFAYIINYGLENTYAEMMFLFVGAIFATIPIFIKREINLKKINYPLMLVSVIAIVLLVVLGPEKTESLEIDKTPEITLLFIVMLLLGGFLSGFSMLLPGVSGSLVLLIVGQYYLFVYYLKNLTSEPIKVIFPLIILGIGMLIGVIASAKTSKYLLNKFKNKTLSAILGLIIGSLIGLVIMGLRQYEHSIKNVIGIIISLLVGILIVFLIENLTKSRNK